MNTKTLYVLLGLVLLTGIGLIFYGEEDPTPPMDAPLREVDYLSVHRLACRSHDNALEWTLEKSATGAWMVQSGAVADGVPVPADIARVQRMLGMLQNTRDMGHVSVETLDLKKWGLDPPSIALQVEDDERKIEVHFGKSDINNEVHYRLAGSDVAFKVDAHLALNFAVSARQLRDQRLSAVPLHSVGMIGLKHPGAAGFTLSRLSSRWFIETPSGRIRGDTQKCGEFVASIISMEGSPVDFKPEAPPLHTLTIQDDGGRVTHVVEIVGADPAGKFLYARRRDDPDVRKIDGFYRRYFEMTPSDLEDRLLTGFDLGEIVAVSLAGPGRKRPLELVSTNRRWHISLPHDKNVRIDHDRFSDFQDRLLNVMVDTRAPAGSEFTADLTARFEHASETNQPPVTVELSAPREDGTRLARRSDESHCFVVEGGAASVFFTEYWDIMIRAVALGMDTRITWIRITDGGGETVEVARGSGDDAKQWTSGSQNVPDEFLRGLLSKLAFLSVEDFVGSVSPESAAAFKNPMWKVEWRHKGPDIVAPNLVEPSSDKKYVWTIGRRRQDSWYEAKIDSYPDLVFRISAQALNSISDAMKGVKRASGR